MSVIRNRSSQSYLRAVANTQHGSSYKDACLGLLRLTEGHRVADLGCGPGVDLTALRAGVGASGEVIGVDLDHEALDSASQTHPWARLLHGDIAHVGDLPDSSVDRVKTDRVLQHVDDPSQVVAEIARLLAPGGRAVLCEPDWDTLILDVEPSISQRYRDFVTSTVIRNSAVGRQLARLCRSSGMVVETVLANTAVITDPREAETVLGLRRVSERAAQAGALTRQEAEVIADIENAQECCAAVSVILTVAVQP
ncbi:methyltransferase domain-containing protein [Luteipulveratus sp. YIM 133132]|uniref:methyltransferase domain-containing protein n=1 Tax=Luteipulveratus flavus TaxID=3031728 RepID=UPI0023AFA6F2|nr:methyltransferase domain-containing protein [Luteipulveratus sp. YIM 133132]MDE9366394.1 methyltransferase domain-containing protein [Luteipulveratus sp. YIM 133132]